MTCDYCDMEGGIHAPACPAIYESIDLCGTGKCADLEAGAYSRFLRRKGIMNGRARRLPDSGTGGYANGREIRGGRGDNAQLIGVVAKGGRLSIH